MEETVYGIYVIRHEGAEPSDAPEDVGIILEGVTVLRELRNVPLALAILLAFVYSLNLSYPPELKYTFEALQKIILELDGNRLSAKVQALKTVLSRWDFLLTRGKTQTICETDRSFASCGPAFC